MSRWSEMCCETWIVLLVLQDDGWLLGVKESHWVQNKDISVKGVFPENFTQKVWGGRHGKVLLIINAVNHPQIVTYMIRKDLLKRHKVFVCGCASWCNSSAPTNTSYTSQTDGNTIKVKSQMFWTTERSESASECFDWFVKLVGIPKGTVVFNLFCWTCRVWDFNFLTLTLVYFDCWMIFTSRDTNLIKLQDFLPFTDVRILLKDWEQVSVPFWLTVLNVEQKKSTSAPLKIVKPTQSGFTVSDKSSWDVILEKGKTPGSLKMNERKVSVWFFLCILGYSLSDVWHKSHNFESCMYVSGHWVVLWSLVCIITLNSKEEKNLMCFLDRPMTSS